MRVKHFFKELKRRNVIRSVITYVAVSWVILQASAILFPVLGLSNTAMQILLIIMIAIFPIWIIFSWIYEYTPDGFKKTEEVSLSDSVKRNTAKKLNAIIITVLALAVVLLLADRIFNLTQVANEKINRNVIAVLPFNNLNVEGERYLASGFTEDISTQLSKISHLKVLSRFIFDNYKIKGKSPQQIGQELAVDFLIAGNIRTFGDEIRISCQLIDIKSGTELWSDSYDGQIDDLFEVQQNVAERVAESLSIQVSAIELASMEKKPTENMEAYKLYLKGNEAMAQYDAISCSEAIDNYKSALNLDPDFGLAWAGLSKAYSFSYEWFHILPHAYLDSALFLAEKSVNLNDESGLTWEALALANKYLGNIEKSKAMLRKAVQLQPTNPQLNNNLANLLMDNEEYVEAAVLYRKAISYNPLFAKAYGNLARIYYAVELYEKALLYINRALNIDKNDQWLLGIKAIMLSGLERYTQVDSLINYRLTLDTLSSTRQLVMEYTICYDLDKTEMLYNQAIKTTSNLEDFYYEAIICVAYLNEQKGNLQFSQTALNIVINENLEAIDNGSNEPTRWLLLASCYAIMHDREQAFSWLNKYFDSEEGLFVKNFVNVYPWFQNLHADDKYREAFKNVAYRAKQKRIALSIIE